MGALQHSTIPIVGVCHNYSQPERSDSGVGQPITVDKCRRSSHC